MKDEDVEKNQSTITETLFLLDRLQYCDLNMPYHDAGVHSNKSTRKNLKQTNLDIQLLDTIAVMLCTGKPGDVVAAAFDKRSRLQLVLAKNGPPTDDDIAASEELVSLFADRKTMYNTGFFPFIYRRGRLNINKRIAAIHKSLQDHRVRTAFNRRLPLYKPETLYVEFKEGVILSELYEDADTFPPFPVIWNDFLDELVKRSRHCLPEDDAREALVIFTDLCLFTETLASSPFFKFVLGNVDQQERDDLEKLKRRTNKVNQYATGLKKLKKHGVKLPPLDCRWVSDNFIGSGEGRWYLPDDPCTLIHAQPDWDFSFDEVRATLDERFPSLREDWRNQEYLNARLHAELRIILDLGPPLPASASAPAQAPPPHVIGVSKRSCLACNLWINNHNEIYQTRWMTSGSHGKPYATWALPGIARPYLKWGNAERPNITVDSRVLGDITLRLRDTLDWLFPGSRRKSDEHVSSESSDSSEDGVSEEDLDPWEEMKQSKANNRRR